jgi:hypothetical protein
VKSKKIETAIEQMAAYLADMTDEMKAGLNAGNSYCSSIRQVCEATGVPYCIAGKVRLHFCRALAQAMTPGVAPVYVIEPTRIYGRAALLLEKANGNSLHSFVGLSKRAMRAMERLGHPTKDQVKNMNTRHLNVVRGVGLKTVQEICRWAGRDFPVAYNGLAPSEKRKPLSPEQRQAVRYSRWLRDRGYIIMEPNASNQAPSGAR